MLKFILSITLLFISLTSFAEEFVAGKDYEIIKDSDKLDTVNGAISVTEFFSYGCPWCYRLEPSLNNWINQQGTKIYFKKIPVVFNKDWEYYAQAYYVVNALSLDSKLNASLFKAILLDKQPLNSNKNMIDFFTKNGVDLATAKSAFNHSPSIELEAAADKAIMVRYHIAAVPALIVNNQFKTDLQMAKTEKRLFAIMNFLLTQSAEKKG